MTDLDRLDALAAAATPGPWTTHGAFIDAPGGNIAETYTTNFDAPDPYADAAFIAACDPATIRSLLAAVRERDELRAAAEDAYRVWIEGQDRADGDGFFTAEDWEALVHAMDRTLHREDGADR